MSPTEREPPWRLVHSPCASPPTRRHSSRRSRAPIGVSVSEAVRAAIQDRIEARRNDRAFRAHIKQMMEEERAVLEQLAK